MRKIEAQMVQAIANNQDWRLANTKVVNTSEGYSHVYLHNNHIATVKDDTVILYDGGWQSVTTKSRLNAICNAFCKPGEGVFQKAFQWFVNYNGQTVPFINGFKFA